jgi:hypothetical protein
MDFRKKDNCSMKIISRSVANYKNIKARCWWLMPVILAETKNRRIPVGGSPGK